MPSDADPVDVLLSVRVGEEVDLEAAGYSWSNPFRVTEIDETTWQSADGEGFRTRVLGLEPTSTNAKSRRVAVVEGGEPPRIGASCGRLVSVDRIDLPDHPAARIAVEHDLDADRIADVIADARATFEVARDLGLGDEAVETLLRSLGLWEAMKTSGRLDREAVRGAVAEHVPRKRAARGVVP